MLDLLDMVPWLTMCAGLLLVLLKLLCPSKGYPSNLKSAQLTVYPPVKVPQLAGWPHFRGPLQGGQSATFLGVLQLSHCI